jgi:4-amino-4-deoxy-L-arabinose transferase-like glycosyltransferase
VDFLGGLHPAVAPASLLALAVVPRLPLLAGGQIDYDEGVYWQSLRAMVAGHRLFGEVYSSQPPGFLFLLLPFFALLGQTLVAARIGVLIFFLAGLVASFRLGSALGGRGTGLLAMAILAADPIGMRESVALQADAPAMALALGSLAMVVRPRPVEPPPGLAVLAAGGLLALAILVKVLAAAAGPALLVALLAAPMSGRQRVRNVGLAAAGGLIAAALVLLPVLPDWRQVWEQSVGLHLVARGVAIGGLEPLTLVEEGPLLFLSLAGLALSVRRAPRLVAVAGSWAAVAALMLAVQRPLWPHHLVALVAPAALLAGGLAQSVVNRRPDGRLVAAAAIVLVAGGAGAAIDVHVHQHSDASLAPAVARLQAATKPSDLVITDDQYLLALAGRDTPPQLVDTSLVRVSSGSLTTAAVEAMAEGSHVRGFLFSTGRLSQLEDLESWVELRYPEHQQLDADRELYLR